MYNFRNGVMDFLKNQGFHVVVAAPFDEYAEKLTANGYSYVQLRRLDSKGINPLVDYAFYKELYTLYKQHRPSVIFNYTIKPNIYGTLAAHHLNIPAFAVVTGLGYVFTHKNLVSFIAKKLYSNFLKTAREIWFLNKEDQQIFIESKMVKVNKTFLLKGEGVNTDYFKQSSSYIRMQDEPIKFILFARMIYDKGIQEFVEASRLLKQKGYQFESQLLGFMDVQNPSAISWETMEQWKAEKVIKYLGVTSNVKPFIESADCMVLPSFYREGIPRSLLEAASMAKPIITTDNVGCRDVVDDGVSGYLCEMKNPHSLAQKMEQFMKLTQEQRLEMGRQGRAKVLREFDEKKILEIYSAKIMQCLA